MTFGRPVNQLDIAQTTWRLFHIGLKVVFGVVMLAVESGLLVNFASIEITR